LKVARILSLATAVAGTAAAISALVRRHQWEQGNNRMAICVDFEDAQAASIRSGLPFDQMLLRLAQAGATHISLPEWTLNRLRIWGQLTPRAPEAAPGAMPVPRDPPLVGHWNYLYGEAGLVAKLAGELGQRLPHLQAAVLNDGSSQATTLLFAGDLPTIGEIGLGFDDEMAALIQQNGLGVVPRPVSYAWPEPGLLRRTLAQAAGVGRYVAFDGDMILGHEMHLDATVAALEEHGLTFVYFAQSRHQKGDWFVAKRRAPHLVLGHRFSRADMVPLDYHAACHNWIHLARERGIRFCYVTFFRVLHATAPLEGLDYVHHLKHALEDAGFPVSREEGVPPAVGQTPGSVPTDRPVPAPDTLELVAAGVAAAGIGAAAVSELANLPQSLAIPLTLAATGGAAALPLVEKRRNERSARLSMAANSLQGHSADHSHDHDHDHDHGHTSLHSLYPPSYAPKLLALGAAVFGPVAAMQAGGLEGMVYQLAASAVMAIVTSGQEYHLRIEQFRGFNLDWLLPLASVAMRLPDRKARAWSLTALGAVWLAAQQRDMDGLALIDPGHAEGHTHHISAAMGMIGDIQMSLGPKPARKWAGLGPLAAGLRELMVGDGRADLATPLSFLAALGYALGLVSFRFPERALQETLRTAGPSFLTGSAVGFLFRLLSRLPRG
jgi:hypothetical protein